MMQTILIKNYANRGYATNFADAIRAKGNSYWDNDFVVLDFDGIYGVSIPFMNELVSDVFHYCDENKAHTFFNIKNASQTVANVFRACFNNARDIHETFNQQKDVSWMD